MSPPDVNASQSLPLDPILGYLNLSAGNPDAGFQRNVNLAYAALAETGVPRPWQALHDALVTRLEHLRASGAAAFRDAAQAVAVLHLTFAVVCPAYRRHHADLLAHLTDGDLYTPFFLARVCEAVLARATSSLRPSASASADEEEGPAVTAILDRLNDFVGYRPAAILETRIDADVYSHERVRPVPLFIRGAGVAWGRHRDLVSRALDILSATDRDILLDAGFDPEQLEELALDPRAYDQGHPVNKRPNYVFGEWDPHQVDGQGRYNRFVVRSVLLEALAQRIANTGGLSATEVLDEEAAVLAATILMAAGVTGPGPGAHDSTTTLATLRPRIARYRDAYYVRLLERLRGPHADRLRREAAGRQPLAAARQHLNEYLARHRSAQAQQRQVALLFAEMGFADRARREAARIPAASARILSAIGAAGAEAQAAADRGDLAAAAQGPGKAQELLRRGIDCGALADPWNVLGFQGLFPLSPAREDSVRDTRIDDLVGAVRGMVELAGRLMADAAAAGAADVADGLAARLRHLAAWWDRFATTEVSGVPYLRGTDEASSAEHVARALAAWHQAGAAAADVAFWKRHVAGFRSARAYAQVVDALLSRSDHRAALGLLVSWVGKGSEVGFGHGEHSFSALVLRWLFGVLADEAAADSAERWRLVRKGFDQLEANAEDYWQVPTWSAAEELPLPSRTEDGDDVVGAAYEDVTYRDSADSVEGALAGGGEAGPDRFALDAEAEPLSARLGFLSALARLWHAAAIGLLRQVQLPAAMADAVGEWHRQARANVPDLTRLAGAIQAVDVARPIGVSFEATVEYDRRRTLKASLSDAVIGVACDTWFAASALAGLNPNSEKALDKGSYPWERAAARLEHAIWAGSASAARAALVEFVGPFRDEQLLMRPPDNPASPTRTLRTRIAQRTVQVLVTALPRLGLLRETYHVLREARAMERHEAVPEGAVSGFAVLFQAAEQAVVQCLARSTPADDRRLAAALEAVMNSLLLLWGEHSRTLRLSTIEALSPAEWDEVYAFVRRYGRDLFDVRFLTLAHLRGLLHQGVGRYLERLRQDADPLRPLRLVEELEAGAADPARAEWCLGVVARALVEHYDDYKDYNLSGAQSDYGDRLTILFDFLRLRASYDRRAWLFQPITWIHDVLARAGRDAAARDCQALLARLAGPLADQHLAALDQLEQRHGLRLPGVRDRLEERFLDPLVVGRLGALVEPAMREQAPAGGPAFDRFAEALDQRAARPAGVGFETPAWIERLAAEVRRVRGARSGLAHAVESYLLPPARVLSADELSRELQTWDAAPWPAKPDGDPGV